VSVGTDGLRHSFWSSNVLNAAPPAEDQHGHYAALTLQDGPHENGTNVTTIQSPITHLFSKPPD